MQPPPAETGGPSGGPPIHSLSRRASRRFVLGLALAALLLSILSVVFLTKLARESARRAPAADSTGAPPPGPPAP